MTEQKYAIKLEPIKYGYRDGVDGTPYFWRRLEFDVYNDKFIGRARVYISNDTCCYHYFERHPEDESRAMYLLAPIEGKGLTDEQIVYEAARSIRVQHDYITDHADDSEKIVWRETTKPLIERTAEVEAEPIMIPVMA